NTACSLPGHIVKVCRGASDDHTQAHDGIVATIAAVVALCHRLRNEWQLEGTGYPHDINVIGRHAVTDQCIFRAAQELAHDAVVESGSNNRDRQTGANQIAFEGSAHYSRCPSFERFVARYR